MGNDNNNNNNNEKEKENKIKYMNKDASIKEDINVYVCGEINPFLDCNGESGFNITASRNYYILEQVFPKVCKKNDGIIKLNNKDMYYQYEFRKKEKDKKNNYNAFLISNKADEEFFGMLFDYLYENDRINANKNVILYFGESGQIEKSIDKLYKKSAETAPILIIINNSKPNEKLKYINYLPNLNTIEKYLRKENKELTENEFPSLSEKALTYYINNILFRIDLYYNQLGYNFNMINPMNEKYLNIKTFVTIALLGYSGCGKSTLVNLTFNENVSRVSPSSTDVTTKCGEYYLPIPDTEDENVGQIRILDFPGITEDKKYEEEVKPEIEKKIKEYKENMDQIDIALFFIPDGNQRELTESGLQLIGLLHEKKIKIIFVINGMMNDFQFDIKKQKLRNKIQDEKIISEDFSNVIHTNFYQHFKETRKEGIDKIFEKIIEIIEIKDKFFCVEDITTNNYNDELRKLSKCNRVFELLDSMDAIKEKSKKMANLTVTGYSLLSLGSSLLSLAVPVVDCVLAIGYQVAMVYNIFNIYELKTKDYNIVKLILTGGDCIEEKNNNQKIYTKAQEKDKSNNNDKNHDIAKGNVKEVLKEASNTAIFAAQNGIKIKGAEEASKIIVEKTVQTIATDSIKGIGIKATTHSIGGAIINTVENTATTTVEKLAIHTYKELSEAGIKEGTNLMLRTTKENICKASLGGGELLFVKGTKESVEAVTETIVVQQGGKAWLINLGKYVPLIGAGISGIMNTYSTAKIGKKLVDKFDEEFDNNQQKKVDLLKGRIYGLFNIIEQMYYIIQDIDKETNF